ncbi:BlaR1 peptidase M56 [Aquisphaera giovannonii]|uniref:BlaR1 peptidase M56 n=1 Tax=Aquisphaera giovannonii TaxID=406548 RepID=A0A5B9W7N3_9BACT|nr:M56 family metallopeptidase [Aquisphaera giovannonii]QEH36095.1 BlaR1 peptidase M56 [Aquisphaera giovannonii]
MEGFLQAVMGNAVAASILALAAAAAGRVDRRPQVAHWLWVLVLLKLLTPPLFVVPLSWPEGERRPAASGAARPDAKPGEGARPEDQAQGASPAPAPASVTMGVGPRAVPAVPASEDVPRRIVAGVPRGLEWYAAIACLGVAATIWLRIGSRCLRFGRLIDACEAAGPDVHAAIAALARGMGIRRPPVVRLCPAAISPSLWGVVTMRLVVPAALWEGLEPERRELLLLHELAHLKRRDHWVRVLEVLAIGLYWWHPAAWWARRAVREAEEYCCDDVVLRMASGRGKAYAHTLLDAIDSLAEAPRLGPQEAIGFVEESQLRRRLVRILGGSGTFRLSRGGSMALAGITAAALGSGPHLPPSPRCYRALDLGSLGGRRTEGIKFGASGEVVGTSETGEVDPRMESMPIVHGFRTSPGQPIDPRTDDLAPRMLAQGPRWVTARPNGINARGQIALSFEEPVHAPHSHYHGFLLDGERLVKLAWTEAQDEQPDAIGINDRGQIVGMGGRLRPSPQPWSQPSPGMERFAFRAPSGRAIDPARDDLGHLGGRDLSRDVLQTMPWAINASGQVVGNSLAPDGWPHAFRTGPDRPIDPETDDLGTLGGNASDARGINDAGQVVGSASIGGVETHAFRTGPNRPIDPATDDLGTLGGYSSAALAINNRGDVVGTSFAEDWKPRAFVYSSGTMIDLNRRTSLEVGWVLTEARDINDRGQILAIAEDGRHDDPTVLPRLRTYVLTPVPDPVPMGVVGLGMVLTASGIGLSRIKK